MALAANSEDALTTQDGTGLDKWTGCLGNKQGVTTENWGTERCSLSANMGSCRSTLACAYAYCHNVQ